MIITLTVVVVVDVIVIVVAIVIVSLKARPKRKTVFFMRSHLEETLNCVTFSVWVVKVLLNQNSFAGGKK